MSAHDMHHDWLSLMEISGPCLAVPVLKEAFPQGLEDLDGFKRIRLRQAYEEWREALETDDPQFSVLHAAWIDEVLSGGLELDEDGKGDVLKRADWCSTHLEVDLLENGVMVAPDLAVVDAQHADKPLMLIHTYEQGVDLHATLKLDGWAVTPADRMVQLCRATGCRLGLVTNGEHWMLVDAPVGAVTTFASWYAGIWGQEPITLQAFVHLLGIRRFFVDESEQLPALFDRSLKYQDEVTDALGEQVRRAVEVLIQALDKADQDRNRELLRDVKEGELYEAALTVMMRLVFVLCAEERGLLLLGDERYEANYALSTLRMQLRRESEDFLERRWDAWSRLLAIFRAVFGGIEHEDLRLPALGGSLFDPDRFPFLEGRAKGSHWHTDTAKPLPIDNRTVLLLLEAIQQFQGRTLSYRALDVEQIGYVYEGLLERTVKRTAEVTLELEATKSAKSPWITLAELEYVKLDGVERLAELLRERSGSSAGRVRNDLGKPVDDTLADRLLAACHGDTALRDRIRPYTHLVRTDPWGYPLVYPAGAFIVTTGSDRRETGTHYTPKSLTEAIVTETLTPIAYVGPAEGNPREQWVLKSPAELLDLRICDPAMGSGAFLVQACRWLAERLVEAWSRAEAAGKAVSVDGEVLDTADAEEPLPRDSDARTVIARRLIAERCLYGVDLNPLAVELAKLSTWLVTLAKGRPFGFLDHNLRCGDSLFGIHRLDQLTELSMIPTGKGQWRLFGQNIERAVQEAIELRKRLRQMPIRDLHDVEIMARLDANARRKLEIPERIADAFVGDVLASGRNGPALENAVGSLAIHADQAFDGDTAAATKIARGAKNSLATELPRDKVVRKPFHWPLELPEVFSRKTPGFDALIGNPPFLGGTKLDGPLGRKYRNFIVEFLARGKVGVRGAADLCAYFLLRAYSLSREHGCIGLIATNSISQGDSREVGLDQIVDSGGSIYKASNNVVWPGAASITVSLVYIFRGEWKADSSLNGGPVPRISSRLNSESEAVPEPQPLPGNALMAFEGAKMIGAGFILSTDEAEELIRRNPRNREVLFPYLVGKDINSALRHEPSRWAINFFDYTLDRCMADYPDVLRIVEERVKPERLTYRPTSAWNRSLRESWWQYFWRPEMWRVISRLDRVLVRSRVSNMHILVFAPTTWLFSDATTVFAFSDMPSFAVLQSNIHLAWIERQASSMRNDLRYTPSSCFQTFVMPSLQAEEVVPSANSFYTLRDQIQAERVCSLRKLYDAINNSSERSQDLVQLRKLQVEMDAAVASLYGWDPDFLNHGFRQTRHGSRFDISDEARDVVVRRLSLLNAERYSREKPVPGNSGKRSDLKSIENHKTSQFRLDFQESERCAPANDVASTVLGWLRQHYGWHTKGSILSAINMSDRQWNAAIADLIAEGRVERKGERRGSRYRAIREAL